MKRFNFCFLTALLAVLILSAAAWAGEVEIKLKDGSRWRGEVNDVVRLMFLQSGVEVPIEGTLKKVEKLYIVVDGAIGGVKRERTIFRTDINSMVTVTKGSGAVTVGSAPSPAQPEIPGTKPAPIGKGPGVFVLPLKGTVGVELRSDEILKMGKHADEYGPGQIIVLIVESPGGLVIEMEKIHPAIQDVKKRHRVVAWIREAISGGAATAIQCDEIYFMSMGTLGAMTMFSGTVAAQGQELQDWLDTAGRWMEEGGRFKYIAHAMIDDEALLSYDKDPVTGRVTWRNDAEGEFVLSTARTNLVFNAENALHSGFSDGTADTPEQLAKLLDLPEWREVDDYGRRLAKEWQSTVEKAQHEIPLLAARMNYEGTGSGDQRVVVGKRIAIIKELIGWWDKCPNVCFLSGVPSKEELQRIVENLRRSIR